MMPLCGACACEFVCDHINYEGVVLSWCLKELRFHEEGRLPNLVKAMEEPRKQVGFWKSLAQAKCKVS